MMTKDDIIKLAQSAGLCDEQGGIEGDSSCFYDYRDEIVAFARACFAIEREACEAIADKYADRLRKTEKAHYKLSNEPFLMGNYGFDRKELEVSTAIRDAIRARGHDVP